MFTNNFLLSSRVMSMSIVLAFGVFFAFDSFSFRSIFIGLVFSHFAMGFYYSKNNVKLMKEKKFALVLASIILAVGIYFSMYMTFLAPYLLVVHSALSDAYLLKLKGTSKADERLAILRTIFYIACGVLVFIPVSSMLTNTMLSLALLSFVGVIYYTKDKKFLSLIELPIFALVIYTQLNEITFRVQYLGFYHVTTWYVFSFWMLFVKEKSTKKTASFFSKVAILSTMFVLLFNNVLGLTITDQSFLKIIAIWSIIHIFSSIPLSKFNPVFLKKLFYAS